jgi:4-hydroxybenzoate polyprenyltransferase
LASTGYIINDLLDLQSDRKHPQKRLRSFAAGDVDLSTGALLAAGLLALSLILLVPLNWRFALFAFTYLFFTSLYSFILKKFLLLDVVALAGLYTIRRVAGTAAIGVVQSAWLTAFSFFIFSALSFTKRIGEIKRLDIEGGEQSARRGYLATDLPVLSSLNGGCICGTTLTLAIYSDSIYAKSYSSPEVMMLFCPILFYWLSRFMLLAYRGQMNYDPVYFAVKDKQSLLCLGLGGLIYIAATIGL